MSEALLYSDPQDDTNYYEIAMPPMADQPPFGVHGIIGSELPKDVAANFSPDPRMGTSTGEGSVDDLDP